MESINEVAQSIATRHATERDKRDVITTRVLEQQTTLSKLDELKLTNVVQTKLLADQVSEDLGRLLRHLENAKPEITKRDFALGLDRIITNLIRLNASLPKELQNLAKILNKPQDNYWTEERLEKVLKKVQPKLPDITIPEPHKEVRIEDWHKVVSLLEKLVQKPDFEKTEISFPEAKPFPKKITVDNLGDVINKLDALLQKTELPAEKAIGFTFERDSEDNLVSITEFYPSGTVKATGWNLGRVRISDDRQR